MIGRALGLVGAGVGGAVIGILVMASAQGDGGSDEPVTATTGPARVAPPPEPSTDVLLAWTPGSLDPALTDTAHELPRIRVVSEVAAGRTNLVASHDSDGAAVDRLTDGWSIPLDTIAIDPDAHAQLASVADRGTVAALGPGEALLGRTSARLRRLDVGATLELDTGVTLQVSGIVEDATVGAAELVVDQATGADIGVTDPRYLLLAHDGDRAGVEAALRAALPAGAPVRFRGQGETPYLRHGDAVLPQVKLKERFGEFAYKPPAPGRREFQQDPAWQSENLVTVDLPRLGTVRCHRAVVDAIRGALAEIEAANLGHLVDPDGFAGCWSPRLVLAEGDAVSHHAWGVALDVNYDANPTGRASLQDTRLVDVFRRWGFTWGGQWLVTDPAHFEYVTPPEG
ncbi:MAG TPA: M15 family metallopeptidase [Acidimicrobiales bacterium]